MHLARLRGEQRPARKGGVFKGYPQGTAKRRGVGREPKATETSGLEGDARAGISPINSKPLVLALRSKGTSRERPTPLSERADRDHQPADRGCWIITAWPPQSCGWKKATVCVWRNSYRSPEACGKDRTPGQARATTRKSARLDRRPLVRSYKRGTIRECDTLRIGRYLLVQR
jgi:hypothetical protein